MRQRQDQRDYREGFLFYNKNKKTLRNSLEAGIFFLNALQSYSVIKHIHRIDFNNFNVLEVCTVQHYLGKYKYRIGTWYQQILNIK